MSLIELTDCIRRADYREVFIEHLGWERSSGECRVELRDETFVTHRIAHKRGFAVLEYVGPRHLLQVRAFIRDLQRGVSRFFHEHLLILRDERCSVHVLVWAFRDRVTGRTRQKVHPAFSERIVPAFLQRLKLLAFDLDEEEDLTILDVVGRVEDQLNTEADQSIFFRRPSYARRSDELARAMKCGGLVAEREFMHFHRRLPASCALRFNRHNVYEPDDLIQIASIGMLRAARHFDPDNGAAFSTYAFTVMMREMSRSCASKETFLLRGIRWRPRQYFDRISVSANLPDWRSAETDALYAEVANRLAIGLETLPEREAEVLKRRFGIGGEEETLEGVGLRFRVTRERIRQIEAQALTTLTTWMVQHWAEDRRLPQKDAAINNGMRPRKIKIRVTKRVGL